MDVNYVRHLIRQYTLAWHFFYFFFFFADSWNAWVKPWLWMLVQKLDSIHSPFSNQYSKVGILQHSKKRNAFGMKRLSYRTRGYQNEYLTISKWDGFYLHFELIGLKANQPRLAHVDISDFRRNSYAKPCLFLALMSQINVAYCHQGSTLIMKPGVIEGWLISPLEC